MFRIIDQSRDIDITAKYEIGQEVVLTSYQGYRKGIVKGISANSNDKGIIIVYTVELQAWRKSAAKVKKCLEKYLFSNVKDALASLVAEEEEELTSSSDNDGNVQEL